MDAAKEKRLDVIKAVAHKLGIQPIPKPSGVHRANHPDIEPRRIGRKPSHVLRERESRTYLPPRFGGFSTFEIPNHYYFEDYLPTVKKEMGERYVKKGPHALTKIAHAKQDRLARVPPWQKKNRKRDK